MDILRLLAVFAVLALVFCCIVAGVLALGGGDAVDARLAEAEAQLTEAQAEELQRQTELTRAKAELIRSEAEADALRTRSEELVKHSRLTRRLLVYSIASKDVLTITSIVLTMMNLATWAAGLYLWRRQGGAQ
jgi:ABC-type transport system involved in cytochrome bd biosynthesis fused ATPase/permease subunit